MTTLSATPVSASRGFPLSDGQLESLLRLCEASPQPMMVVDDHGKKAFRNGASDSTDLMSLASSFELVDHRDRVLGHLHVKLT